MKDADDPQVGGKKWDSFFVQIGKFPPFPFCAFRETRNDASDIFTFLINVQSTEDCSINCMKQILFRQK